MMVQAARFMARDQARPADPADPAGRWRMGLVARALFAPPQQAGLVLRWRESMALEELAAALAPAASALGLSQPKKPKKPKQPERGDGDAGETENQDNAPPHAENAGEGPHENHTP